MRDDETAAPLDDSERSRVREYVGFVWIGEEPGVRLRLSAQCWDEAVAIVEGKYGQGHMISIWSSEDASKLR